MAQLKTPDDFGNLIRQRRKALAWGQAELAHAVGVSRRWVIQTEKGKPGAELGLILRTLTVLGLRLDASPCSSLPVAESSSASANPRPDINRIIDNNTSEQDGSKVKDSAAADLVGNWLARANSRHAIENDSIGESNVLSAPGPAPAKRRRGSR